MNSKLNKRVALLSIMLLAGVLAGAIVTASWLEKAAPETGKERITIVKTHPKHLTPEEREHRHAQYEARRNQLIGIAMKDDRVQKMVEGKNYSVVGVGLKKHARNASENTTDTAFLLLRVERNYYKVTIDVRGGNVTSIEARTLYGVDND